MWVKERNERKNEEKCVNGAIVPDREKIEAKFGEFSNDFLEAMETKDTRRTALEERVTSLEGIATLLSGLLSAVWRCVGELEDMVMEEPDTEGDMDPDSYLSSSTDVEPVENVITIPVPAPSVIHTLVPVDTLEEFIPSSLCGTPSPPHNQSCEEDPVHDGVPEYWVDPSVLIVLSLCHN